ncbi:MAG: RnfABCDGE type electron transport complex subunit G [Bacteroidales bacterium]|nr:RnfABCDGE type electron transport complex subunit G [Bacteroidales bacterium]
MAAKSTLINMVAVLGLTCLLCSAILAGAYALTKEPIDKAAADKTARSIALVVPEFDSLSEELTISCDGKDYKYYEAVKGEETVGYAIVSKAGGFGGDIVMMVGIDTCGVICNTSVLSHNETPGLGAKCNTDEHFMEQWKGFNPSEKILSVKKDGGDVDAITASTITSRAYTKAVDSAVEVFKSIRNEQ